MWHDTRNKSNNACYEKDAVLVISSELIAKNVAAVRQRANAMVIAVVKENGYGLGLADYYHILEGLAVEMYAVTSAKEALALREEGCQKDILMMTPLTDLALLIDLMEQHIILALGSGEQLPLLQQASVITGLLPRVHIKIDTGMGRYGFIYDELPDFRKYLDSMIIEGCFTHLAGSSRSYKSSVRKQIMRFEYALEILQSMGIDPGLCHAANSRAVMTFGSLGYPAVRVGSALLGKGILCEGMKEAVWLETRVFSLQERRKGDRIGYHGCDVLRRDSTLAVLRIGTGCGVGISAAGTCGFSLRKVMRACRNRLTDRKEDNVWIGGQEYPVIGRPGLGHMTVDVTGSPVKVGDIVRIRINPLYVHPFAERIVR